MQKKVIVLAIAAALSAPAMALADSANVTLYGVANVSADYVTTGDTDTTPKVKGVSKLVVSSNVSYVGLKGSEDLGNGMAAVWQIESQVNLDGSGTSTLGTRNSFVGLKSGMGTVLMGRHDTPYKMATRNLDVFADSIADNRSLMGTSSIGASANFDGSQPDVLAYVSPTFSNITVVAARVNLSESRRVSGGEDSADFGTGSGVSSANAISLAGMYNAGPFFGSLAYETHNIKLDAINAGTTHNENAIKLGFGYTQDAFSVGVAVETIKDDFGSATDPKGNALGHTSIYVGGKYNLASGAVKAAVTTAGKRGEGVAATDTEGQQLSVGYDHHLSKRTTVYAIYTMLTNKKNAAYSLSSAGSTAGSTSVTGPGADPSALSLGIKHSF